jgi:hypothetical protein
MTKQKMRAPLGTRRGIAKNFTLDADAVMLLGVLAVGKHAIGRLLSELIRKEAERRAERPQLLAALRQELEG